MPLVGYHFTFLGAAALAGVGVLVSIVFMEPLARNATDNRISFSVLKMRLAVMTRQPGLYLAGFVSFFAAVPVAVLSSFYPVHLAQLGLDSSVIGVLSSFRGGAASVASLLAGHLIAKLGLRKVMILALGGSGLGLIIAPLSHNVLLLAVSISLIGAASGLLLIASMSLVAGLVLEQLRGLAMAYTGTFFSMALFVVPVFMGEITALLTTGHAFASSGIVVLICAGLSSLLWGKVHCGANCGA